MTEIKQQANKSSRIVGIDYGMARIGLALSDEQKIIATPLPLITTDKKIELTAQKIALELKRLEIGQRFAVSEIVIGLPLRMNGQLGVLADEVKHLVELLSHLMECPIVTWDERLTTVQAERSMREGNMSRKKRSKIIDSITAVIILQNYLDRKNLK